MFIDSFIVNYLETEYGADTEAKKIELMAMKFNGVSLFIDFVIPHLFVQIGHTLNHT